MSKYHTQTRFKYYAQTRFVSVSSIITNKLMYMQVYCQYPDFRNLRHQTILLIPWYTPRRVLDLGPQQVSKTQGIPAHVKYNVVTHTQKK